MLGQGYKSSIINGINGAVEQVYNKRGIKELQFSQWKSVILSHIDFQINKYKNNFQHQKCKLILNNSSVKEVLEKLQHDFVVSPIDKVFNNVSFIC